uniref:Putative zinc finger protein n=1 Tax=Amblyomma triste TaxID=251400 RepID=A0A023GFR9_AMBTT
MIAASFNNVLQQLPCCNVSLVPSWRLLDLSRFFNFSYARCTTSCLLCPASECCVLYSVYSRARTRFCTCHFVCKTHYCGSMSGSAAAKTVNSTAKAASGSRPSARLNNTARKGKKNDEDGGFPQRGVHLASVVDGNCPLENEVHITLDDFLREWSGDPHPRFVRPILEDTEPAGPAAVKSEHKDPPQGSERANFECPICADCYTSSRSLRRHLSRRSFIARLPCRKCGTCHLAFNRCTLIMRAQGCRIGASNATVSALPPGETLVPVELSDEGESGGSQTDVPMTVLEKVLQSVVCSECYANLDDEASREDHFHPSRGNLIRCANCPMLCTSECALRAHRRLHSQRRPFVCPECGLRCEDEWAVFHQHVTKHCHHFERIVGYHCQLCPALLLDKAELAGHIVDTHSSPLHKCQICPMAFVSLESFQTHRQTAHPKHLRNQWWVILKCPLCEAVFASAELLANHATAHLDQCGRSLFKCASCDSLQPTRADLVAHVCKLHPDKHQATAWGKDEESLLPGIAPKKEVSEVINLDDDEMPDTGSSTMTTNSSPPKPKKEETENPNKAPVASSGPAEKGKKEASDHATDQPSPVNSGKAASDNQENKSASSPYVCAKCEFESNDSSVFRDHIKQHRPPHKETFQCPQCGLCYVVEPSLMKHLRGVHRVDQTEIKENAVAPDPNGAADSSHRCSVCLATFATERELKSHTRSHGMAFLKKVKAKDGSV